MLLVTPRPVEWRARFEFHQTVIAGVVSDASIEHIGSTAIGFIRSKDVVDILVGLTNPGLAGAVAELELRNYALEGQRDGHCWMSWPGPENRSVVVHVVRFNGEIWNARLAFRDTLLANRCIALEYEALKHSLASTTDDWTVYTSGKSSFVARVVRDAKPSQF
jgi:GrpB-like predicted nucleotidyltransferase (UPF0157 family)